MSAVRVVTLRAPGLVWRVASEPVTITGDTSGAPLFADGLLYDVQDVVNEVAVYDVQRSEFDKCNVSMGVPADVSVAELDAAFGHLAASTCEVAVYDPVLPWRRRTVLIGRGIVSGLAIDVQGMALSFVVEASNPEAADSLGDGARDMGMDFPGSSLGFQSLDGKQWPVGVGRLKGIPGHKLGLVEYPAGSATYCYALGLFGHHIADTGQTFTVYEDGATYTPTGTLALVNDYDSAGEPISYIVSDDATLSDFVGTQGSFTVDLDSSAGVGTAAVGAAQVLRWLLTQSGIAIDWARMQPAFQALAGLDIGIYTDSETGALRILRERVLPALPLIEETGPAGLWLRMAQPSMMAIAGHLEEGSNLIGFTGAMEQITDPDDIRNRFVANYAYDHYTGAYIGRVVVDWETHPACAISYSLEGARVDEEIDLDMAWTESVAAELLRARAERLAMHRYTIPATVDVAGAPHIDAGQCWTVTAPSRGWTQRRCLIRSRTDRRDVAEIVLEPMPLPVIRGAR